MKLNLKYFNILSSILLTLLCSVVSDGAIPQPDESDFAKKSYSFYGDQRCVELLAGLISNDDELIREAAVFGLGQCDNANAVDIIEKASEDKSAIVRAAAVQAAGNYRTPQAESIVITGLKDNDMLVVDQSLQTIRFNDIQAAGDTLKAMLELDEAELSDTLKRSIVSVLTSLNQPVSSEQLLKLLNSQAASLKLRACENMLLSSTVSDELLTKVKSLADYPEGVVAAGALTCLVKFAAAGSKPIFLESLKSENALARACGYDGLLKLRQMDFITTALEDSSVPVRLAAIKYSGQYRLDQYSDKLFELMLAAPFEDWHQPVRNNDSIPANIKNDPHLQARESLKRIGSEKVIGLVADYISKNRLPATLDNDSRKSFRNVTSCMWILGQLHSDAAIDAMLSHIKAVAVYESYMQWMADAMGNVGNPKAVAVLREVLAKCQRQGARHLADRASGSMNVAPFSEPATAAVIKALLVLGDYDFKACTNVAFMAVSSMMGKQVLGNLAGEVISVIPQYTKQADADSLEELISKTINDKDYPLETRKAAAVQAGKLKIQKAVPFLQSMLGDDEKRTRSSIKCAGWALQEITGNTPELPEPTVVQGNWIIRKTE